MKFQRLEIDGGIGLSLVCFAIDGVSHVARNLFARYIQIVEGKGWKTVNEILLRQIACEDCADIAQRQRQEALLSFACSIGNQGCGLDIEIQARLRLLLRQQHRHEECETTMIVGEDGIVEDKLLVVAIKPHSPPRADVALDGIFNLGIQNRHACIRAGSTGEL